MTVQSVAEAMTVAVGPLQVAAHALWTPAAALVRTAHAPHRAIESQLRAQDRRDPAVVAKDRS